MRFTATAGWCLVLVLGACLVGCQRRPPVEEGRTQARGTVTLDDKPVTAGTVRFVSVKDPMYGASAYIRSDGTFLCPDAPEGPVRVGVADLEPGLPAEGEKGPPPAVIPKKYADSRTSGLTATVTRGDPPPPISIELKSH
jgi:hypothetical protein